MTQPLLVLEHLAWHRDQQPLFADLNFRLEAGEKVALVGANGAGKSSLLHLILGLHRPTRGRIYAFDRERQEEADFRDLRTRVGLLFQDSDDQLFCPRVIEDVAFGPLNLGLSPRAATERAHETLAQLGLDALSERVTYRLSGGEKRLVALATVLAMEPQVLLLDEPTNGLDESARTRLLDHLEQLPQAMLFASHDRRLVARLATRAVLLEEGRLLEGVIHSHPHVHRHSHVHIHPAADSHLADQPLPGHRDHHLD